MILQKNSLLLLFAFLLLSMPVLGQKNDEYKAGYIVSNSNDTLHGYFMIDYRVNKEIVISFKKNLNEKTMENLDSYNYACLNLEDQFFLSTSVQDPNVMQKITRMIPRSINGFYEVFLYEYKVNGVYPREDFFIKGPNYFKQLEKKKSKLKPQLQLLFADDEFVLSEMERIGVSYDNAMMFFKVYNKRKAQTSNSK
ncbi:hypothetical protein QWY31_11205 [Cytophagales bacterium LB-30]|uniref:Uncharacterized protein n=1 Tax=Shiella aurantiaca TaxID=3058365 RepID=A0ABT8F6R0_9BACT|nr:hypothetical protein [Shiella aurantiaca]MDN4166073.1 hypothetical protein [Shiella aurantiaca]